MPSSSKSNSRERPGAPESNAGDEFHVLWAARRAVRLLDTSSPTQRVIVEGVGPVDDPDGDDAFLGADLTEFEGGDTFAEADRTVLSQLKYSTRHPQRAWSVARLSAGGRGPHQKRPVVYRLAQQVGKLLQEHGSEAVRQKLSVRLVSNQPVSEDVLEALAAARALLQGAKAPTGAKRLLGRMEDGQAANLNRLWEASELPSRAFLDFVWVVDLGGTGEASVDLQRLRLVQELGLAVTLDPTRGVRALERLISIDASPHGVGSVGLTRSDVLAALEVTGEADLYPSPPRFHPPKDPIPVREAEALAGSVVAAEGVPVIAHGIAGVGKTTTVLQVGDHLPPGSEVVFYDCYGDGSYLNAGAERHTPRRALTQLTNELAARFGTPFLLERGLDRPDLYRRFLDSLDRAGRLLPDGAVLVVAIDAADNAAYAAQREGDESFVPPLLRSPLPPSVRLLVTSRTHRTGDLHAPEGAVERELRGFDLDATAAHVRRRFPGATDDEAATIHVKTGGAGLSLGNPRVQEYLLQTAPTLAEAIESAAETPEDIFRDLYKASVEHAPDEGQALDWVGTLVAMGRPAPIRAFATLVGADEPTARRFVRALEPGVVLEEADGETVVGFRDEDFETDLRERVGAASLTLAHGRIADTLLTRLETDTYAARAVADHLFAAGRSDALLRLVLEGPRPDVIEDPLARLEVNRNRSALALRAAASGADRVSTARVLLAAAEFARGEEATLQLIREAPGLAVRFGDTETVAGIYVRESTEPWKGPAHLHAAVLLARTGDSAAALDHARAAEAWMRRWRSLRNEGDADGWRLDIEDIAHEAEVAYWLRDAGAAYERVTRWYPRNAREEAARVAVRAVAAREGAGAVEAVLSGLALSPIEGSVTVEAAWAEGVVLDDTLVLSVAEGVEAMATDRRVHRSETWAVGFAEAVARAGGQEPTVRRILDAFGPPPATTVPTHFMGVGEVDGPLRAAVLLAALRGEDVTAEALRPASTEALPDPDPETPREEAARRRRDIKRRSDDRERWDELVGAALPTYRFRAEALLGRLAPERARLAPAVAGLRPWHPREDRHPGSYSRYRHVVRVVLEGLGFAGAEERAVEPILDALGEAEPTMRAHAWLSAGRSVRRWAPGAVEDAVERAVGAVADEALPAKERWTVLWEAADLVQHEDADWAADLYAQAVEAASDLDDDGARLLGTLARVLESTGSPEPDPGGRMLAHRLARAVEHHTPYVSDERYLPKETVVRATAGVDAQAGLALAARWDDEGRLDLSTGVRAVCVAAGATGGLAPARAVPLLRLVPFGLEVTDDLLPHLDRLREAGPSARGRLSALVADVSRWVQREVPARSRGYVAGRLTTWAGDHGLTGLPGLGDLSDLRVFLQDREDRERARERERRVSPPVPTEPDEGAEKSPWQIEQEERRREAEEHERRAAAAYDDAVADATRGDFTRLGERLVEAGYRSGRPFLLTAVRDAAPRRARTTYLDALVDLELGFGGSDLWAEKVLTAFEDALRAWTADGRVRRWLQDGVPAFAERWLPWLIRRSYGVAQAVRTLFTLPGLGPAGPEITVAAVARRVADLSAEALLHVGGVLAEGFSHDERRALVEAALDDWESEAGLHDGEERSGGLAPSLGGFLWSAFGHYDREVRWRALHAARAIAHVDGTADLLESLVAWSRTEAAGPYRDPSRLFYWQAALATLHVLLLRIVHEDPDGVRPFAEEVAERALSASFPHVQVRELARRTALALEEEQAGTYDAPTVERLRVVNQPTGRSTNHEDLFPNPYDRFWISSDNGARFDFDYLDQVPFWYRRLERRLDVPALSVLERADVWICDRWGLPDVDWRADPRTDDPYDRRDMHVYKGDHPRRMGAREHLTLHAMFCAAGELLDDGAALRDSADDYDSWERWLESFMPVFDGVWVHDLMAPVPLDPLWWGEVPEPSRWAETGGLADYDRVLGLPEGSAERAAVPCDEIVVDAWCEASSPTAYDYVRVESWLVSPDKASALQRAFQSNPDWRQNATPTSWSGDVIAVPGFVMKPWLDEEGPEEALDRFDPFLFQHGLKLPCPDEETVEAMQLVREGPQWRVRDGRTAFRLEAWSSKPSSRDESREPYSTGTRLWVCLDALLPYLHAVGLDLLIEASIQHHSRRDSAYSYDSSADRSRDDGHAVYTLVRRDGTFRSLDLDRRFGRTDRA